MVNGPLMQRISSEKGVYISNAKHLEITSSNHDVIVTGAKKHLISYDARWIRCPGVVIMVSDAHLNRTVIS